MWRHIGKRDCYLSALERLEENGSSHVVPHQQACSRDLPVDGFASAQPSYRGDVLRIYRLEELRNGCRAQA